MWCICIFCICTLRAMQCLVYLYFERKAVLVRRFHSRGLIPPTRCRRPSQRAPNTTMSQKPKIFPRISSKTSHILTTRCCPSQRGPNSTMSQRTSFWCPTILSDIFHHCDEHQHQHQGYLRSGFRSSLQHLVLRLRFRSHCHRGGDQQRLKK